MSQIDNIPPERRKGGNPNWVKGGASPNPGGRPKRIAEIEAAIAKAEGPEEVCSVIKALRLAAIDGDALAAKVYLERVLGAIPKAVGEEDSPPTEIHVYIGETPDLPPPVTPETTST